MSRWWCIDVFLCFCSMTTLSFPQPSLLLSDRTILTCNAQQPLTFKQQLLTGVIFEMAASQPHRREVMTGSTVQQME